MGHRLSGKAVVAVIAVLAVLAAVGIGYAQTPTDPTDPPGRDRGVREQNLDANGQIKVHEQGVAQVTGTLSLSSTNNTVKLDPTANTVNLGAGNTVKLDPTTNTVNLGTSGNTVKLDPTSNTVRIGSTVGVRPEPPQEPYSFSETIGTARRIFGPAPRNQILALTNVAFAAQADDTGVTLFVDNCSGGFPRVLLETIVDVNTTTMSYPTPLVATSGTTWCLNMKQSRDAGIIFTNLVGYVIR
jgi:hypothetical protein